MTQSIPLKNDGTLEYNNEMLVIQDKKNRRSQKWMTVSSAIWAFITGPLFLLKEDWARDNFMMWVWLFVVVAHAILFIKYIQLSYQEVIMLDEIKSARVKSTFNNTVLMLRLRNGRLRQVGIPGDRRGEMLTFVSANFG